MSVDAELKSFATDLLAGLVTFEREYFASHFVINTTYSFAWNLGSSTLAPYASEKPISFRCPQDRERPLTKS